MGMDLNIWEEELVDDATVLQQGAAKAQNDFDTKAFNKKIPKQNNNLVVFIYVSDLNPNPLERQQIHDSKLVCSFFSICGLFCSRRVFTWNGTYHQNKDPLCSESYRLKADTGTA